MEITAENEHGFVLTKAIVTTDRFTGGGNIWAVPKQRSLLDSAREYVVGSILETEIWSHVGEIGY